jgi:hypothetical protein
VRQAGNGGWLERVGSACRLTQHIHWEHPWGVGQNVGQVESQQQKLKREEGFRGSKWKGGG